MFILKKGHQPGVYVPLRALFLVFAVITLNFKQRSFHKENGPKGGDGMQTV